MALINDLPSHCPGNTAPSDRSLALASDAWLFIVFSTAYFGQDAGLLNPAVEPFE